MKLATLKDGSRDGQLVVVSRDLGLAHFAAGIATRLQQVLDDWNFVAPQLEELSLTLNHGKARHAFVFDPRQCMAPLPRACQRASAAANPGGPGVTPWMVQGASDELLGPTDDALFGNEAEGMACQAGLAVVTGDVPMGATPEAALEGVRLLMLVNEWQLQPHPQPAPAFGPVAVTPDELGAAWQGGRVQLMLDASVNGQRVGRHDAGAGMTFHFGQLIAHLARARRVRAGSIVCSGAIGAPAGALRFGDTVRSDVPGADGQSMFGAIDQCVSMSVA